jgi:hypothetical protein
MVSIVRSLYAKTEAVYGTAEVLTNADFLLVYDLQVSALDNDTLATSFDRGVGGGTKTYAVNRRRTFSFKTQLFGSGAAGTAPKWMQILGWCGMTVPAITAGVKAEQSFTPLTGNYGSATLAGYRGGYRRRGQGARGEIVGISFELNKYPELEVSMSAILPNGPLEDAVLVAGAPNLAPFRNPLEVSAANTEVLVGGYEVNLRSFVLKANNSAAYRSGTKNNEVLLARHLATFTAVIDVTDPAAKDFLATLATDAEEELKITHGTVAGEIITLTLPKAQIQAVADGEDGEKALYTLTGQANITNGGDDVIIAAS